MKTLKIPVEGMHCSACALNVEQSLKNIPDLKNIRVNINTNEAYFELEDNQVTADDIIEAVKGSGYDVPLKEFKFKIGGMHCASCQLNVSNALQKVPVIKESSVDVTNGIALVTAIPVENVETLVRQAVEGAGYEFLGLVDDHSDPSVQDAEEIDKTLSSMKRNIYLSLPAGAIIMLMNHVLGLHDGIWPLIQGILALPLFFFTAFPILKAGWKALRHKHLNMDVMYSMGMMVAVLASIFATFEIVLDSHFLFYDTALFLTAFLTIGRYLETKAKSKTSDAIKKLAELSPDSANILSLSGLSIDFLYFKSCPNYIKTKFNLIAAANELGISQFYNEIEVDDKSYANYAFAGSPSILLNGNDIFLDGNVEPVYTCRTFTIDGKMTGIPPKTAIKNALLQRIPVKTVHTRDVKKGDLLLIKPGEKIPVDGKIISGRTEITESMITGEPLPVLKKEGDSVIAGTINNTSPFYMKAEKVGEETVLANIIKVIERAQMSRPPIQKLADVLVSWFIPVVLAIAIGSFLFWFGLMGQSLLFSLTALISVLVVACPCALGLATPTALTVGMGKAAELGILIQNTDILESAHTINKIVLDKTGTLTEGKPVVTEIRVIDPDLYNPSVLLAAEQKSNHPLAKAVVEYLTNQSVQAGVLDEVSEIPGKGIIATVSGDRYLIGNTDLHADNPLSDDVQAVLEDFRKNHHSTILYSKNGRLTALIGLNDRIKENSRLAIRKMKELNLKPAIISGDNKISTEKLAKELGIDEYYAEVTPEQKLKIIESLQSKGDKIAFIGDGINDAPALTRADIGIAVGAGSDIARESGDIILMKNSIYDAIVALDLSKQVMKRIKGNLFWAVVYNFSLIPVAAGYFYPIWHIMFRPELAGLAMAFSSVSVVTFSLRLKKYSFKK